MKFGWTTTLTTTSFFAALVLLLFRQNHANAAAVLSPSPPVGESEAAAAADEELSRKRPGPDCYAMCESLATEVCVATFWWYGPCYAAFQVKSFQGFKSLQFRKFRRLRIRILRKFNQKKEDSTFSEYSIFFFNLT
jgi:hypothetical protein